MKPVSNITRPTLTRIAPAGEEHLPAISALAGVIWRACYPGIITEEQIDYMLARMYAPDTLRAEIRSQGIRYERLLVDNDLVGFAAYGPTQRSGVFKLHKLYLHPAFQGRGLGSRLLNHCERRLRGQGGRRLVLNVNRHNTRAIAAYRRNGFKTVKSLVADIGGGFFMDDFIMAKSLV